MPLFSVVVPVYNLEKYVGECLNSLINQDYKDIEIIVVDDGSSDRSAQICDEFAKNDTRIRVIHKKNGGLVNARIDGAINAKGTYIVCVDGDDWVAKDYLLNFADIIKKYNPDILCAGSVWVNESNQEVRRFNSKDGYYTKDQIHQILVSYLIEDNMGRSIQSNLWAKAFEKELYLKFQTTVPQKIKIGEDAACFKPALYDADSLYVLPECGYFYRYNPESMTKIHKPFDWEVPKLIALHFECNIEVSDSDIQNQIYRNTTHRLFNVCVSQFFKEDTFSNIKKDIAAHLNDSYYSLCIEKSDFKKGWKVVLAQNVLKHRWYAMIYLYSKYLKRK